MPFFKKSKLQVHINSKNYLLANHYHQHYHKNMTYEQVLKQIDVNTEETLQRFSGNKELMEKFIKKFPEDNTTDELEKAIKAKDYKAIEDTAHTLEGQSDNLGFTKLYEISNS